MTTETTNKIIPLGGEHKSASSMLAEVMNDPELDRVAVFVKTKSGHLKSGHFGMLDYDMAMISIISQQMCLDTLNTHKEER